MFDTGSRVRSAYGSGSNRTPSLKPRHMRSCNVRVLPNPRITLWFRCGGRGPDGAHCFNVRKKRCGTLAPIGGRRPRTGNVEGGRQRLVARLGTAAESLRGRAVTPSSRHHAEFLGGVLKQQLNLIKTVSIDVAKVPPGHTRLVQPDILAAEDVDRVFGSDGALPLAELGQPEIGMRVICRPWIEIEVE